jgi:hypothetical protein
MDGAKGNQRTFNLLCAFGSYVFVVQIFYLLFLGRGKWRGVRGGLVRSDYHAVCHLGQITRNAGGGLMGISGGHCPFVSGGIQL